MLLALNFKENVIAFSEYLKNIDKTRVETIFFPCNQQFPLSVKLSGNQSFGSQDYYDKLTASNVKYCIVGHSDKRQLGETDKQIAQKIKKCLQNNITPILCVGELNKTSDEQTLKFLKKQISKELMFVEQFEFGKIIVAYEPVFCIGTGQVCDVEHVKLVINFIKKQYSFFKVLYGGSVNDTNCEQILKNVAVDGFLVGKSALNPEKVNKIAKIMENFK